MTKRWFGTDGIRGRVGEEPITPEFMLRLGRAAGAVLGRGERCRVVIGKDTRISGYMFESALESGLAAAGADIALLGPMPTPAIAYLTRTLSAQAGIVISASHNPYHDNGIKFFSATGGKLPDELELQIEAELQQPFTMVQSSRIGKAQRIADAIGRYVEYCKGTLPFGVHLHGLKLVVDCANGATYQVAPLALRELGAEVIAINVEPDGLNINRDCGSTHPEALAAAVRLHGADIGVAFDGDGDRVVMCDHRGELVDGDHLLYIMARDRQLRGKMGGENSSGVVGTVMTNFGLEQRLKELRIPFERTPVGDRHVHQRLLEKGWFLGGETSGHILCLDRAATGDGMIAAMQVLNIIANSGRPLAEWTAEMPKYPQHMINLPVPRRLSAAQLSSPRIERSVREAEAELNGCGRVILRPSGTEPLVRITVEGPQQEIVVRLAEALAGEVGASLRDAD
ncbi:MAG: phosphoglucosamine mutase [Wenzhouxiangellaceae bacterium]